MDRESSIASAVTGWRTEAAVPERRASEDVGFGRLRTKFENLEVSAMFRMGVVPQPPCAPHRVFAEGVWQRRRNRSASLSSCSSRISDASYADTDASMSELASSVARLTQSSNGSDNAMTDVEEIVSLAGQMSSEPLPNFQMQAMCPEWEA